MDPAEVQARRLARRTPEVYVPPPAPPAPERPWQRAATHEVEGGAAGLQKKAQAAGWTADAYVARGPYLGAAGEVLQNPVDVIAVLFRWGCGPVEAWATFYRRKDKYELGGAWLLRPVERLNSITLGQWLTGEGPKSKKGTS